MVYTTYTEMAVKFGQTSAARPAMFYLQELLLVVNELHVWLNQAMVQFHV